MYIYIYLHIHIFTQLYTYVCVYTYINICTHITLSGVTWSWAIKSYVHPQTQTYQPTHIHMFAPTFLYQVWQGRGLLCIYNTYTYIHVPINICPHVCTHIPPSGVTGSRAIQTLTPGPFASRAVCVWHDSFICVPRLIHMCDMTNSYVWHDAFICVTWRIHMCDMTICVTWLIRTCDMTHSYLWHDLFMCVTEDSCICMTWDSFIRVTWLIHS